MKTVSKSDMLTRVREQMGKIGKGSGTDFWKPEEGKNVIRILPGVGEMPLFYQEVGRHFIQTAQGTKSFYCPRITLGKDYNCPICETAFALYRSKDKANLEVYSQIKVNTSFWMNIISRADKEPTVHIYTPGVLVMQKLNNILSDPDYIAPNDEFFIDLLNGRDLTVMKSPKGNSGYADYDVVAKPQTSPVLPVVDEDNVDKWWTEFSKACKDFTPVQLTGDTEKDEEIKKGHILYVPTYEMLKAEFNLDSVASEEDDEEDFEDDEVEETKTPPTRRSFGR